MKDPTNTPQSLVKYIVALSFLALLPVTLHAENPAVITSMLEREGSLQIGSSGGYPFATWNYTRTIKAVWPTDDWRVNQVNDGGVGETRVNVKMGDKPGYVRVTLNHNYSWVSPQKASSGPEPSGFPGNLWASIYNWKTGGHTWSAYGGSYPWTITIPNGTSGSGTQNLVTTSNELLPGSEISFSVGANSRVTADGWGSGTGASSTQVITSRIEVLPNAGITLHQIGSAAHVSNLDGGVDDPLKPKPDKTMLEGLPVVAEGLVADGVTPLVFALAPVIPVAQKCTISFSFPQGGGILKLAINPLDAICSLDAGIWKPGNSLTMSVLDGGKIFYYLKGIPPGDLIFPLGAKELPVTVKIQLGTAQNSYVERTFRIRKPPVALVHGYNTPGKWSKDFLDVLKSDRPDDFIVPVQYGWDDAFSEKDQYNTYAPLSALTYELDSKLHKPGGLEGINSIRKNSWAYTRYDAVGHSQGGVLLRMLSSRKQDSVCSFRSAENFNRGRFRRVVSIGSPHNGSILIHYGLKLAEFKGGGPVFKSLFSKGIFQPKFDPWGKEIIELNSSPEYIPDLSVRFFMIRTTIRDGQFPPYNPMSTAALYNPLNYTAYEQLTFPGVLGYKLLPFGSDGAVDFASQADSGDMSNVFTISGVNISHADGREKLLSFIPVSIFETDIYQTASPEVSREVRRALDSDITKSFAPPLLLNPDKKNEIIAALVKSHSSITQDIENRRIAKDAQRRYYSYKFVPAPSQEYFLPIIWTAEVHGGSGLTDEGVSLTVNPDDSRRVMVTVEANVVGDVVLHASHALPNGASAFLEPIIVASIAPSASPLSLKITPTSGIFGIGTRVNLESSVKYSDGNLLSVFPSPDNVIFTSSNSGVAEVSSDGIVQMKAPGEVSITVACKGLIGETKFNVPASIPPLILQNGILASLLGQPLHHQISATNFPSVYSARGLPKGLSIDVFTGIISGIPEALGQFNISLEVMNLVGASTASFALNVGSPTIENWRTLHFGNPDNTGNGADMSDYDHDGIPNLAEFAFGLHPKLNSSGGLPEARLVGSEYVTTFDQPTGLTGITYGAEWSSSMLPGSWTVIPDSGNFPQHRFAVPSGTEGKIFTRLKVSR